jgi:hypothetical protein
MARKVWRYTMNEMEQKCWQGENMQGWRQAFCAWIEDESRAHGCLKYIVTDMQDTVVVKGEVRQLTNAPQA